MPVVTNLCGAEFADVEAAASCSDLAADADAASRAASALNT